MNALDVAVTSAMKADTVSGGLNEPDLGTVGGFHQLIAPQGAGFPRCHFQLLDDLPHYTTTSLAADHVLYQIVFHAVDDPVQGAGTDIAGRLAERARSLFTDPAGLVVSGKVLMSCRFRNSVPPLAVKDDSQDRYIYSKGLVLDIWLTT